MLKLEFLKRCLGFTLVEILVAFAIMGTLGAIAVPLSKDYLYRAEVVRAMTEIRTMEREIILFENECARYPNSLGEIQRDGLLDPWGAPYQYLNIADAMKGKGAGNDKGGGNDQGNDNGNGGGHPKGARKDKHEVPLNNDFDLYSMGRDGQSKAPLQNPFSHDDVVRANDGEYVGLASGY